MSAGQRYEHDHDLFFKELNDTRILLWRMKRLGVPEMNSKRNFLERKLAQLNQLPKGLEAIYQLPLLSASECDELINLADKRSQQVGWSSNRHANFPTHDLAAKEIPGLMPWMVQRLQANLYPLIESSYGLSQADLYIIDIFIVNYEMRGQRELDFHEDTALLTFSCLLNDEKEFQGGGLYLSAIDKNFSLPRGVAIVHAGKWLHRGVPIEAGRRVILVGFIGHRSIEHEALADVD